VHSWDFPLFVVWRLAVPQRMSCVRFPEGSVGRKVWRNFWASAFSPIFSQHDIDCELRSCTNSFSKSLQQFEILMKIYWYTCEAVCASALCQTSGHCLQPRWSIIRFNTAWFAYLSSLEGNEKKRSDTHAVDTYAMCQQGEVGLKDSVVVSPSLLVGYQTVYWQKNVVFILGLRNCAL